MKTKKSAPASIWCAFSYDYTHEGYLITEPGNIHRPFAFVDIINGSANHGFEVAKMICNFCPTEPWRAVNRVEGIGVVDLTQYGRRESMAAMPGFVYGLRCLPVKENGEENDGAYLEPRPWCRFMFDALSRRQPARKAVRK